MNVIRSGTYELPDDIMNVIRRHMDQQGSIPHSYRTLTALLPHSYRTLILTIMARSLISNNVREEKL